MAVIKELVRSEADGTISFGDYTQTVKSKLQDFEHQGDLYKVKTYNKITKLERNGMFAYESVPGTAVNHMSVTETGLQFLVEGIEDAQITVELAEDTEYKIFIDDTNVGKMKTNLSGKLALSVELSKDKQAKVKIVKL